MNFKIYILLNEHFSGSLNEHENSKIRVSKLSGEVEAGLEQFERNFKKETGKSTNRATLQEIKNSRAWKRFIRSLHDIDEF